MPGPVIMVTTLGHVCICCLGECLTVLAVTGTVSGVHEVCHVGTVVGVDHVSLKSTG